MPRLLIATTNHAKLDEYRLLLRELDLELLSLADLGITAAPDETGATFEDNALAKARFYFRRSGLPTLADDGGLEVDALGGAPGVHSHRWLGPDAAGDDRALAEAIVRRMESVDDAHRSARLRAAVALVYPRDGQVVERVADAALEGVIARSVHPQVRAGFPYRAVMWLPERNCFLAALGPDEEARISQRRTALAKLRPDLVRIAARPGRIADA
jgi:XTP/dITP diphosphohydrolase